MAHRFVSGGVLGTDRPCGVLGTLMIQIGFTGTQQGMSAAQYRAVDDQLHITARLTLIHGDCVGADAQFHMLGRRRHLPIIIYPSDVPSKRAWCEGAIKVHPQCPPLTRNELIVDNCDMLIVTPRLMIEELRSGTWSTVRYARRVGKPILLVYPDGSLQ